jgi:hypothetical protein
VTSEPRRSAMGDDTAPGTATRRPAEDDAGETTWPSAMWTPTRPEPGDTAGTGDEARPVPTWTPADPDTDEADGTNETDAPRVVTGTVEPPTGLDDPRRGDDIAPPAPAGRAAGPATVNGSADAPVTAPQPVTTTAAARFTPMTASPDTDGSEAPLLGDADSLRANWQRLQARFVDEPRRSVEDAADMVEHTVQTLVGALRERQTQLRGTWEGGGTSDGLNGEPMAGDSVDSTEQLRLVMRRYRALFEQICGQ